MTGGADPSFPPLFLSYAHTHWDDPADQRDADYWVRKFYGNLSAAISALTNAPPGYDPVFADHRIKIGDRWPDELVNRLARCAVFVPLYSPKYFHRPDCGREWSAIRLRQDMHVSATSRCPNIVIPVLWQPIQLADLPSWAQSIQYTHESLGTAYHTMGLESLLRLRDHQDSYNAAVRRIAERIVEVVRSPEQLRPLHEVPRFQTLPDAFAAEGNEPFRARWRTLCVIALVDPVAAQPI